MFYKHLPAKQSLETLQTEASFLDPDLYRTTIHAIIAQIRYKYNGPQLKELLVNINRLEEYNMIKLARCNKELERQATFSFKLTQIENLLEKFNVSFLKILEDSPDYRLDDLYRRFVHINHKLSELDPDHMKIFGGNINDNTGSPGRKIAKFNQKLKEKADKSSNQNGKLLKLIQQIRMQNEELRRQIQSAKLQTREVIDQLIRFREVQRNYQEKVINLETEIRQLHKKNQGKNEIIRQKDQLIQNYKSSIEKLKFSLLTPTKLTKMGNDSTQKIVSTTHSGHHNKGFDHNTAREPVSFFYKNEQQQRLSPQFRSQKGGVTPKSHRSKTPPKPPSIMKLGTPKNKDFINDANIDMWNMLLIQCASLQQLICTENE